MKEKQTSRMLMNLNSERIFYKSLYEKNISKKNNLNNAITYVLSGNIGYIWNKVANLKRSDINLAIETQMHKEIVSQERLVIYTVMFGKYDVLCEPIFITEKCDYYIITDQEVPMDSVWKKYPLKRSYKDLLNKYGNLELARYFKTHPHELFKDYKYSMFIDANVQIVADMRPVFSKLGTNFIAIHLQPGRDCIYQEANAVIALNKGNKREVKRQIEKYKNEKFPKHFGLFQTNIMIREHNTKQCIELMEKWWSEIKNHTKRDQLSFTYCLWKMGYNMDNVSILGSNSMENPRFWIKCHKKS